MIIYHEILAPLASFDCAPKKGQTAHFINYRIVASQPRQPPLPPTTSHKPPKWSRTTQRPSPRSLRHRARSRALPSPTSSPASTPSTCTREYVTLEKEKRKRKKENPPKQYTPLYKISFVMSTRMACAHRLRTTFFQAFWTED